MKKKREDKKSFKNLYKTCVTQKGNKKANEIMEEVFIEDKQKYLNENYPFGNVPSLEYEGCCIHCDNIFKVGKYKVFKDEDDEEYICCANAPVCNGTVIDWIPLE